MYFGYLASHRCLSARWGSLETDFWLCSDSFIPSNVVGSTVSLQADSWLLAAIIPSYNFWDRFFDSYKSKYYKSIWWSKVSGDPLLGLLG